MSTIDNINGIYAKDTELRNGISELRGDILSQTIKPLSIIKNGTYTADPTVGTYGYSPIAVDVPIGAYVGTDNPSVSLGENGDYYYKRAPIAQSSWTNTFTNYSFDMGYNIQGNKLRVNKNISVKKFKVWMQSLFTTQFVILALDNNDQWSAIYESAELSPTTSAPFIYELSEPIALSANTDYIIAAILAKGSFYYKPVNTFTVTDGFTIESKAYTYTAAYESHNWNFDTNNYCFIDIEYDTGIEVVTNQYHKESGSWVEIGT